MAIVLSGSTNDILVNGVSVATDAEVSSAIEGAVQTGLVALQTIATGTATFTATTNNINLTGIGIGVEIGDVIQITGADDAKNNSEFTIEVITDANNIIVNQAHANKGTSKNVAARASDTGVQVKLLAKWYNAPIGLGRASIVVTASRGSNTLYLNNTNREIFISIASAAITASIFGQASLFDVTNNQAVSTSASYAIAGASAQLTVEGIIPKDSSYKLQPIANTFNINSWSELR